MRCWLWLLVVDVTYSAAAIIPSIQKPNVIAKTSSFQWQLILTIQTQMHNICILYWNFFNFLLLQNYTYHAKTSIAILLHVSESRIIAYLPMIWMTRYEVKIHMKCISRWLSCQWYGIHMLYLKRNDNNNRTQYGIIKIDIMWNRNMNGWMTKWQINCAMQLLPWQWL